MRRQFDEQLEELAREMISMGAMIESAIDKACDALMRHDVALAKSVMEADHLIDQKERTIESMCLRLLLIQQPIARDLRKVSSALKMITDMERIGDQAADICEIVTMMDGMEGLDNPRLMRDMAHETVDMVHKVIDAYVASDVHLAQAVHGGRRCGGRSVHAREGRADCVFDTRCDPGPAGAGYSDDRQIL